jgi:hypothetical protein
MEMAPTSTDELFRKAAEAEGGMPVSAGARESHIRLAIEGGRSFHVDLTGVPPDRRARVVAEIKDLIKRASETPAPNQRDSSKDVSTNS